MIRGGGKLDIIIVSKYRQIYIVLLFLRRKFSLLGLVSKICKSLHCTDSLSRARSVDTKCDVGGEWRRQSRVVDVAGQYIDERVRAFSSSSLRYCAPASIMVQYQKFYICLYSVNSTMYLLINCITYPPSISDAYLA